MSPKTKGIATIDVFVAQLIEHLPSEARSAKHEALSGSAHKLRAVVKVCEQALRELENAVLWNYDKTLIPGERPTAKRRQAQVAEAEKHFEPLVDACIDLIRSETALVNGTDSLPFVLGLFETRRRSVLAAIRLQLLGGLVPVSGALQPGLPPLDD